METGKHLSNSRLNLRFHRRGIFVIGALELHTIWENQIADGYPIGSEQTIMGLLLLTGRSALCVWDSDMGFAG
jgi:hypothetical protein